MRSSRSKVTFSNAFSFPGYSGELPAGRYEVVVEEELLRGLSFEAYRRTATFLRVKGRGRHAGRTEMRPITKHDLDTALSRDRAHTENDNRIEAPRSALADMK